MKSRPPNSVRARTQRPQDSMPRALQKNARSNAICIEEEISEVAEDSLLAEALAEGRQKASACHITTRGHRGRREACAQRSAQASTLKPS